VFQSKLQCSEFGLIWFSLPHSLRLSSVGRASTSATEPSVQLGLESGTISADGPQSQTAGLVIQPFQTVAEYIFTWSVGPKRNVNPPLNCALEILLLTYIVTYLVYTCDYCYCCWTNQRRLMLLNSPSSSPRYRMDDVSRSLFGRVLNSSMSPFRTRRVVPDEQSSWPDQYRLAVS